MTTFHLHYWLSNEDPDKPGEEIKLMLREHTREVEPPLTAAEGYSRLREIAEEFVRYAVRPDRGKLGQDEEG